MKNSDNLATPGLPLPHDPELALRSTPHLERTELPTPAFPLPESLSSAPSLCGWGILDHTWPDTPPWTTGSALRTATVLHRCLSWLVVKKTMLPLGCLAWTLPLRGALAHQKPFQVLLNLMEARTTHWFTSNTPWWRTTLSPFTFLVIFPEPPHDVPSLYSPLHLSAGTCWRPTRGWGVPGHGR